MLDASQSIELVQDLLGHKDIRSSTIYAKISSRRRSQYLGELEKAREIVKVSY
jgi:site-specific recombinase XerC